MVVFVLVRIFEPRLIFFPNYSDRLEGDWYPRALVVQDVWLTASDGVKLHAWWIPHHSAKFTFLAFHANASNIANRALFRNRGEEGVDHNGTNLLAEPNGALRDPESGK